MSQDNIYVVAGAAGGIGQEALVQLSAQGRVIAVVQNEEQLRQIDGLAWHGFACDLADAAAVEQTLARIRALAPAGLRGVVVCAAIQPVGVVEVIQRPALERAFAINVFGTLQFVQGLIPPLRQARGRIVLFSSQAGRFAPPMLGAYAATKFALEALADALRRELRADGVSISLVEPGGVDTPMAASQATMVTNALATLDAEATRRYGPLYRGYMAMTQKGMRFASSPADVAGLAVRALTGRGQPRARYIPSLDARLMIALSRWLPWRWFDALIVGLMKGN